jgi:hypothetical protein
LAKHDRASVIVAYDMKRVLADIDTDGGNGGLDGLGHRRLLVVGTPCQLQLLAGQEHGRTIPLADAAHRNDADRSREFADKVVRLPPVARSDALQSRGRAAFG